MSRADEIWSDPMSGAYLRMYEYAQELEARVATIEAETREACAKVCDSVNNYDNPMTAGDVADAIRAMQPSSDYKVTVKDGKAHLDPRTLVQYGETRDAGPTPFAGRTTKRE